MLREYFEPFVLLQTDPEADGCGGHTAVVTPVTRFQGALTHTTGSRIAPGGRPTLQEKPVLLHEADMTLCLSDQIRREKDGAVYRVTGSSVLMRSPAFSGLDVAQADVERVVTAC